MDKLLAAGLVIALVLAGAAYAMPMWYHGWMVQNGTNMSWRNATGRMNLTDLAQFRQALLSGDWQTAESLHAQFGFGGPFFDRLNQTTFGQYSQILNLSMQLREELGMGNSTAWNGMRRMRRGHIIIPSITHN